MAFQVIVIGLGQFGMSLARTLTGKGAEVMAVDICQPLVDEASSFVTDAVCIDATDEQELLKLRPRERDAVICTLGGDAKEGAILCTALLRQMGTPMIVSRAHDSIHERVLRLVGAHEVINPEMEYGKRFASKLLFHDMVTGLNLADDLLLTEIHIPLKLVGKTLAELALPSKYNLIVAAIRRGEPAKIIWPKPAEPLQVEDRLLLVGSETSAAALLKDM